jgi:hypothetical protein
MGTTKFPNIQTGYARAGECDSPLPTVRCIWSPNIPQGGSAHRGERISIAFIFHRIRGNNIGDFASPHHMERIVGAPHCGRPRVTDSHITQNKYGRNAFYHGFNL